jgi:hypothetical protein
MRASPIIDIKNLQIKASNQVIDSQIAVTVNIRVNAVGVVGPGERMVQTALKML